jgi:hypothetical protein
MYVLLMEKHELDFSNECMYNVLQCMLLDCTRHTRTLPLLTYREDAREGMTPVAWAPLPKQILGLSNAR